MTQFFRGGLVSQFTKCVRARVVVAGEVNYYYYYYYYYLRANARDNNFKEFNNFAQAHATRCFIYGKLSVRPFFERNKFN